VKVHLERTAVAVATATILVIGSILWRVDSQSRVELETANAHGQSDRAMLAIEHYRRAIRWSLPASAQRLEAVSALESIAAELETSGDPKGALLAWRSLSGGLASTRFVYSGPSNARENANDQIARLLAMDRSAEIDANLSETQLAADHRRLLSQKVSPDPWWGTLLLLGMTGWVGALVVLARRGFDSAGRFQWSSARGALWAALVGFVSFTLGLIFA